MLLKLIFILFFFSLTDSTSFNWFTFDMNSIPDYVDIIPSSKKLDVRQSFIQKKNQREKEKNIDRLIARTGGTIHVDGIAHFDLDSHSLHKAKQIESDFKNLLSMKSMKYVYKRGAHWRTWRAVPNAKDNKTSIVCYRCVNELDPNCTECGSIGYWEIEEALPCPYEILSITKDQDLCAVNHKELNTFAKKKKECPSLIKHIDLTKGCRNPILTVWRFTRNYAVPERKSVICEGRDYCEILTLYQIQQKQIIFRIINATEIIYSRVMKDGKKRFACVQDCGSIDLETFAVKPNDKSIVVNLLKKKREDTAKNGTGIKKVNLTKDEIRKKLTILIKKRAKNEDVTSVINNLFKNVMNDDFLENDGKDQQRLNDLLEEFKSNSKKSHKRLRVRHDSRYFIEEILPETTTKSHCKKIIDATADSFESAYDNSEIDYIH